MLSLKDGKGSIHIADIMPKGRGKAQPIYYFFDVDDKRLNNGVYTWLRSHVLSKL